MNLVKFGWPFYLHILFSIIYYGSVFPNTYYAKISSINITFVERIVASMDYILPLILHSPIDLIFLMGAFILFLMVKKRLDQPTRFKAIIALISIGSIFIYLFWIGFDHLNPRLLGVPLFFGMLTVFEFFLPHLPEKNLQIDNKISSRHYITATVLLTTLYYSTFLPIKKLHFMNEKEYGKYSEYYNLLKITPSARIYTDSQIASSDYRVIKFDYQEMLTQPKNTPHIIGFIAEAGTILEIGSNVNLIDCMGLADPLMARIRSTQTYYAPGHNYRPIPKGYGETLLHGVNQIEHPEIAVYYDKLNNVISGRLFSTSRFRDIFYLMIHKLSVDPNDSENFKYFLSPQEYDKLFAKKYGVYRKLKEFESEFNFYSLDDKVTFNKNSYENLY
ncbi:MAG: hypothetical protein HWE07_11670 [Cytophagia bacterium]|nr:hypothetical protein [Cytophagia bacterium]